MEPRHPQPTQGGQGAGDFDVGKFSRWLRMLLVVFYNDDEIVVVDLLLRREAQLRDATMAKLLRLSERQVRQTLERRLVPDGLVERQTDGDGERSKTFYRISPAVLTITAGRLQLLEDHLAGKTGDEYRCPQCSRCFDCMQAMSCGFICGECGAALSAAGDAPWVLRDRLERFRVQCRDLLLLTRELKDMSVPYFPQESRLSTSKTTAASSRACAPAAAPRPPSLSPSPAERDEPARVPGYDWFCSEVLQGPASAPSALVACRTSAPRESVFVAIEETVSQARTARLEGHLMQKLREVVGGGGGPPAAAVTASHSKPSPEACAGEGRSGDFGRASAAEEDGLTVMVQGRAYPLAQVRAEEVLQDRMADDEYQRFADLEREVLRTRIGIGR